MERLTARKDGNSYYINCIDGPCDGIGSTEKCDHCEIADMECEKLTAYEDSGLDPDEIEGLKKSEDYWHREAISLAAELGELKMKIGKLIESNLSH